MVIDAGARSGKSASQYSLHRQHRGARVEAITAVVQLAGAPARTIAPLEDRDIMAPPREMAGGGQTTQTSTDDQHASSAVRITPGSADANRAGRGRTKCSHADRHAACSANSS